MADHLEFRFRGHSRSFPVGVMGVPEEIPGPVLVLAGTEAWQFLAEIDDLRAWAAVLVELHTECLADHIAEPEAGGPDHVLGFSRFRMGDHLPTTLVELVRLRGTSPEAIQLAQVTFQSMGLEVVVCRDAPGRILDRLLRPHLNQSLDSLDRGLAEPAAIDHCLRVVFGTEEGPIERLRSSGLHHHARISRSLFEATGDPALALPREAAGAHRRHLLGCAPG